MENNETYLISISILGLLYCELQYLKPLLEKKNENEQFWYQFSAKIKG